MRPGSTCNADARKLKRPFRFASRVDIPGETPILQLSRCPPLGLLVLIPYLEQPPTGGSAELSSHLEKVVLQNILYTPPLN
jgi:hypothetical protein